MKVIWEEADIKPGRTYGKPTIKERCIIGFIASEDSEKRYVTTSLSDGMVGPPHTKRELAISLTESGYLPGELLVHNDQAHRKT